MLSLYGFRFEEKNQWNDYYGSNIGLNDYNFLKTPFYGVTPGVFNQAFSGTLIDVGADARSRSNTISSTNGSCNIQFNIWRIIPSASDALTHGASLHARTYFLLFKISNHKLCSHSFLRFNSNLAIISFNNSFSK